MEKILTADEAYELHIAMWSDMKKALGNNPTAPERVEFKENWCKNNGYINVSSNCFLCEYTGWHCEECPVDWGNTEREVWRIQCVGNNVDYRYSPISEILALPRRELTE